MQSLLKPQYQHVIKDLYSKSEELVVHLEWSITHTSLSNVSETSPSNDMMLK